jgi:phage I-like protein
MATPRTEIRLFRFGANETEKGTFYLTEGDAKACMKAYRARQTELSWDYDHDVAVDGVQGPRIASAWSRLELRADGLWAAAIKWTKRALGLIADEEYKYFSPFFEHTEDGHITNIINVALTNIPATHGIDAIAASARPRAKGRRALTAHGRLQEIPRGSTRRATTTTRATAPGRTGLTMDKEEIAKKLAAMQEQCAALAAALAEGDDPEDDEDKPKPEGMSDDAEGEAASVAAALCVHTGLKSPLKALAKLLSGRGAGGGGEDQEQADRAKLIEEGIASGKLQPSLKVWAETLSVASLRKFLSGAKPVVKTRASADEPAKKGPASTALSPAEAKVCKDMGIKPEKFLEQRAKLSAAGGGQLDDRHPHRA